MNTFVSLNPGLGSTWDVELELGDRVLEALIAEDEAGRFLRSIEVDRRHAVRELKRLCALEEAALYAAFLSSGHEREIQLGRAGAYEALRSLTRREWPDISLAEVQ